MRAVATHRPQSRFRRSLSLVLLRGPFWRASRLRRWLRLSVLLVYSYLAVVVLLMALEDVLFFPGAFFDRTWRGPPPALGIEEVRLASTDGETVHGWWLVPAGWRPEQGAVLYSHGNGRNISTLGGAMGRWRDHLGRAVLIYDYPGYGKSSGWPNESGCYAAGDAAYGWLIGERKVPAREVVLVGESLGTAVAAELATRHEHRLLVLIHPFTSAPDIAREQFPFVPARWLVRKRMGTREKMGRVKGPVFITHGDADRVVPFAMGRELFEAAPGPKRFLALADHPHAPPRRPEFFAAVRDFLAEVRAK
jgi:uncharacterized protein